ncbi:MAG: hypothetical protein WCD79_07420 [Chthoniobacteraceae bacterium]
MLTALFVVLISLPLFKQCVIGEPNMEAVEGRPLNTRPELSFKRALRDFPEDYEAYYNDHFGFRAALLQIGGYIGVKYANVPLSPYVIIGKEGWLFLKSGQTEDNFHGGPVLSDADLERWRLSLEHRQELLARRGIQFLFVIAPDKQTVYPEYLPDRYRRPNDPNPAQLLMDYLAAHSKVHVLSLIKPLMDAKESGRLYFRHDTHWNTMGAYVGYREIMERLYEWFPDLKPRDRSEFQDVTEYTKGDLARMIGMPGYSAENEPALKPLVEIKTSSTPFNLADFDLDALWNFTTRAEGISNIRRVVMIHDSYTWRMEPFLSADIAQITYITRSKDDEKYEKILEEVLEAEKPDIFIEERVERYLLTPPPDEKILFGGTRH